MSLFRRSVGLTLQLVLVALSVALFTDTRLCAQTDTATLRGTVLDPSGAVIPDVTVSVVDINTTNRRSVKTNEAGTFSVQGLAPSIYRITVEKLGFEPVTLPDTLTLHSAARRNIQLRMHVERVYQSISVSALASTNSSPGVSLTVTHNFIENMPLNGRSLQDLIQLAPGAVVIPKTTGATEGYYSINGQRPDGNNYTVDGVSANLGGYNNQAGSDHGLSGNTPSQSVLGTTQNLVSVDGLQEFTIQTSGYTAEYGRNPGAQVQLTTRSGTNAFHGSLFEYLRNTAFDAKTFQQNYFGTPQTAEHQNDFGGTIGGPVVVPRLYNGRDKTFYFVSYEALRLTQPAFESEYVPTSAFRQWASASIRPLLNASPLPSDNSPGNQDGCTVPTPLSGDIACDALFNYGYSYPSSLDSISVRVDRTFTPRLHAFVRFVNTPSSASTGAEQVNTSEVNTHSWTVGLTAEATRTLLNDLHFNYSYDGESVIRTLRSIGGSQPWDRTLLIPSAHDGLYAAGASGISLPGTSLKSNTSVSGGATVQHQYQLVDSLAWVHEKHNYKFGIDWRRLTPAYTNSPYYSYALVNSRDAIEKGYVNSLQVRAQQSGQIVLDNLSLYIQDHWIMSPTFSLDYGLRWEFNPPPGPSNGVYPLALTSSDLRTAQIAPLGTPAFKTNYHSFAPRLGFAWTPIPSHRYTTTLRGGFGIFFDTGQDLATYAYTQGYPFSVKKPNQSNVALPLGGDSLAPPSFNAPLTPPYSQMSLSDPGLTAPYTEQWNLSLDQSLTRNNTLTISYVGNNGRKLLFTQYYGSIPSRTDFTSLYFMKNGSQSTYNALQVQDTGRLTKGLDVVASFSWAHALDNASSDFSAYSPMYGNSDYDLRRTFNLGLNYQTAGANRGGWVRTISRDWLIANRFSAQSGYPITTLTQRTGYLPDGTEVNYLPDRVVGVPIYLHGRDADFRGKPVPGSWRLNSAAFAPVPIDQETGSPIRQGTLGRNYVRNPSFWAFNTAAQRTFELHEDLRLIFRAEAFNLLNHPNLSNPDYMLSDSTFGQLVNGYTSTLGSSGALYSMGASRSLQFGLRLAF